MGSFNRLNDRFVKFLFANPSHKSLLIAFLNEVLADTPVGAGLREVPRTSLRHSRPTGRRSPFRSA